MDLYVSFYGEDKKEKNLPSKRQSQGYHKWIYFKLEIQNKKDYLKISISTKPVSKTNISKFNVLTTTF